METLLDIERGLDPKVCPAVHRRRWHGAKHRLGRPHLAAALKKFTTRIHTKPLENSAETQVGDICNQGNLQRDIARYGNDKECRLLTIKGLGYRSPAYRETKQLVAEIESALGGAEHLSPMERQMIQHGAVLGAIAQDMETKYLLGRHVDLVALTRVLNAQRRAFDAIGYQRRQRDVTPSLDSVLVGLNKEPKENQ